MTFRPPFEGKDQLDLIHRIENEPPVPPRQIDPRIPRDLETIVLIALAKDPKDRFDTAKEMAKELRRFVEYRPIHSRPIPYYQQFWRWCKRNPWLATANVSAAALTIILAVVATAAALIYYEKNQQADRDKLRIQLAVDDGQEKLAGAYQAQARAGRYSHQMGQRFDSLDALKKAAKIAIDLRLPPGRFDALRDEAIACMALPDLKATGRAIPWPQGAFMHAFDSTLTRYALRFHGGSVQVRRVTDDHEIARFQARGDRDIRVLEFSPDGRYLATTNLPGNSLTVWDVERGTVVLNDPRPISWGEAAKFSPNSRRIGIVYHGDRELVLYDLETGRTVRSLRMPTPPGNLAFRADGVQIAVLVDDEGGNRCFSIFEVETGQFVRSFPRQRGGSNAIAWSPDGATLAISGGDDSKIYLWDAATGILNATLEGSTNGGIFTAFHPAGTLLASCGYEGRLRLWDPALGRPWLSVTGGSSLEFSQDGRVVLQSEDKLTTYQVDPALEYRTSVHVSGQPTSQGRPSIRSDGRVLALGTDRGVAIWDLARGVELAFLPIGLAWHTAFEPTGDLLTSGDLGVLALAGQGRHRSKRVSHRSAATSSAPGQWLRNRTRPLRPDHSSGEPLESACHRA